MIQLRQVHFLKPTKTIVTNMVTMVCILHEGEQIGNRPQQPKHLNKLHFLITTNDPEETYFMQILYLERKDYKIC